MTDFNGRIREIKLKIGDSIKPFNRFERLLLDTVISSYENENYWVCCAIGVQLYEQRLTRFYVRRTSKPEGFVPMRENVREQLELLTRREEEITEANRMTFKKIIKRCHEECLLPETFCEEAIKFYEEIRIPVAHGLLNRLSKTVFEYSPLNEFQLDQIFTPLFKATAKKTIEALEEMFLNTTI